MKRRFGFIASTIVFTFVLCVIIEQAHSLLVNRKSLLKSDRAKRALSLTSDDEDTLEDLLEQACRSCPIEVPEVSRLLIPRLEEIIAECNKRNSQQRGQTCEDATYYQTKEQQMPPALVPVN